MFRQLSHLSPATQLVGMSEVFTHLMEHPQLVGLECSNDGVQHSAVVEQHEIAFVPVLCVDEL
jgi:hypothetical protein